jgi:ribosomal protein S18 acetylase RimI-like enzyme
MIAHQIAQGSPSSGMRRFELQRDLLQLADLIELAFKAELERTGNRIVNEMRWMARLWPLLWLVGTTDPMLSPLMSGYVWIEGGQLVGNVTLSLEAKHRGVWNIGNVAVHPDYRGRGIAGQLLETSLREAQERKARWIILEVQRDNLAAQRLYRRLGFEVYDTTTHLRLPAEKRPIQTMPSSLPLRTRRPEDWRGLYELFRSAVPATAQEVRPLIEDDYRLGVQRRLVRWLRRLLHIGRHFDQVLEQSSQIIALLHTTTYYTRTAHSLSLTVHPSSHGSIEDGLLAAGLNNLSRFPGYDIISTVSSSHPEAQLAFDRAGFQTVRVLDQMRLNFNRHRGRENP